LIISLEIILVDFLDYIMHTQTAQKF